MLYIHPILEIAATLVGLYALYLGWGRFQSLHMGRKASFARKRHMQVGAAALLVWLGGIFGGIIMVRLHWGEFFLDGDHASLGLSMAPLILFGLISGYYLYTRPAPRKLLPLLHGLANLALVIMAICQINEGVEFMEKYVWPK